MLALCLLLEHFAHLDFFKLFLKKQETVWNASKTTFVVLDYKYALFSYVLFRKVCRWSSREKAQAWNACYYYYYYYGSTLNIFGNFSSSFYSELERVSMTILRKMIGNDFRACQIKVTNQIFHLQIP